MIKLSDAINSDAILNLASLAISIGDVYEITLDRSNGIIPKPGDTSRDKYFIILGYDCNGMIYGGVIINSNINLNLPSHIQDLHMPIRKDKYAFLKRNSYVDCVQLKTVTPQKFNTWKYLGKLDDEDVDLIVGTVKESPRENKARLKAFGII